MVGDDKLRGARAADGVFDEAAPPVRAGGVDALAAPVGQAEDGGRAEQLGQPAGQVAALDVAIVGDQRPARDQPKRDQRSRRHARGRRAERVLQVQQAQVVLAALADHDALVPLGRVGEQMRQFGVDLALQVSGEGADPDAAVVLLRPQAGRRQVARGSCRCRCRPRPAPDADRRGFRAARMPLPRRRRSLPGPAAARHAGPAWRPGASALRRRRPGGTMAAAVGRYPPIPAGASRPAAPRWTGRRPGGQARR